MILSFSKKTSPRS